MKNQVIARLITRFPSLAERFVRSYAPLESTAIPWTPILKPVARCRIALVTTAGVHHRDQQPFDMVDREGDPSYRVLDLTRPADTLMITHDYYDHRDADLDLNIVFPAERLREFAAQAYIGQLAERAYGFMGHITGPHISTLQNRTAREVATQLKRDRVDLVVLTPG